MLLTTPFIGGALWRLGGRRSNSGPSITRVLGPDADAAGHARVYAPRPFRFPDDHAAHPDYRHEWWYFTGNLASPAGRSFGFQLTFFRFALRATPAHEESALSTRHALLGHFAVTDITSGTFQAFQRLERPVLGISGWAEHPPQVWLRDWRMSLLNDTRWSLQATAPDVGLSLTVESTKPVIAQGVDGYSRKGTDPGNASLYYSQTRLEARGAITLREVRHPVTGHAWLDREWGSSALDAGTVGWDWFGLQCSDGSELMLYVLRNADGGLGAFSAGSWCAPDGHVVPLARAAFAVRPRAHWRSPSTGTRYPSRWEIEVPALGLKLDVSARVPDQEWRALFRYWEGCVEFRGSRSGLALHGTGYAELTGY